MERQGADIKIVKLVFQKNKDIHAAMLDYRNTPPQREGTFSSAKAVIEAN